MRSSTHQSNSQTDIFQYLTDQALQLLEQVGSKSANFSRNKKLVDKITTRPLLEFYDNRKDSMK